MNSKNRYDTFLELIRNYEPCALIYSGLEPVPYKVALSLTEAGTYQLIDPVTNEICGTVSCKDPDARFFCTNNLKRPGNRKLYTIITLPDGSRKEFDRARSALESGAVEKHIMVHTVSADTAISHIMLDMEDAGLRGSNIYSSLEALKYNLNIDDPGKNCLYEFYDKRDVDKIVRHYFMIDSCKSHFGSIRALNTMANVYGWKVEVEKRYE